jgi:ATP-binding cassette, subfamily C, bacterial CydD
MAAMDQGKAATRAWLTREHRTGTKAARPVILFGVAATLLAIGQALCAADILSGDSYAAPLGGFALFALARAVLGYLSERAGFAAGAEGRRRLRTDILTRLMHARPSVARARHSGDLATLVVDRIEAVDGFFARYIPATALMVISPLIVLMPVVWLDPMGGLILGLTGVLVPVGMAIAGIGAAAASRDQFTAMTRLQTRFLDRIRGIATIVMLGRAEDEAAALARSAAELTARTMRVLRVAFLSSTTLDLAAALGLILLALRYAAAWNAGALAGARDALLVLLLVPEFFAPFRNFAIAYQDRFQANTTAETLGEVPELPDEGPPKQVRGVETHGVSVAFEDVCLTWDKSRPPALNGLTFRVPAGEMVVLTGPSGAGKSTTLEILLGFIRPDSGRVLINGRDIADIVPAALSGITAWIGQRPVLFAGTIRENILFAKPDATEKEFAEAIRAARVDSFVARLPEGLETRVGEGGYGLSGGQAQRIAIARAFLKNAPLLLLDEPTAHLDPATESEVLDGLRRLAAGRTVIMASHAAAAHAFSGRRLDIRDGRVQPAGARGRGVA